MRGAVGGRAAARVPDLFTALFLLWRFWLGVGIGGDYPLSAVISSEYASTRLRGPMISAVARAIPPPICKAGELSLRGMTTSSFEAPTRISVWVFEAFIFALLCEFCKIGGSGLNLSLCHTILPYRINLQGGLTKHRVRWIRAWR